MKDYILTFADAMEEPKAAPFGECQNCNQVLTEDDETDVQFCLDCFDDLTNT